MCFTLIFGYTQQLKEKAICSCIFVAIAILFLSFFVSLEKCSCRMCFTLTFERTQHPKGRKKWFAASLLWQEHFCSWLFRVFFLLCSDRMRFTLIFESYHWLGAKISHPFPFSFFSGLSCAQKLLLWYCVMDNVWWPLPPEVGKCPPHPSQKEKGNITMISTPTPPQKVKRMKLQWLPHMQSFWYSDSESVAFFRYIQVSAILSFLPFFKIMYSVYPDYWWTNTTVKLPLVEH